MLTPLNDWWRYAMGAVLVVLGILTCFVPGEKLHMKIGSKSPPKGAKPLPRWLGVLMSLSFAIVGADLAEYKLVQHRFPSATPERQGFSVAIFCLLAWGLGNVFAGLHAEPDLLSSSTSDRSASYRSSAFLGAFVCLLFALAAAYFGFANRH